MTMSRSALAGVAGATTLTALHQAARYVTPDAPRMDILGMRALARLRRGAGAEVPPAGELYRETLLGDLLANSAYYSLVGAGDRRSVWGRGIALGLVAGVGALVLPRYLGLGDPPRSDSTANRLMTVAWYLAGGLAAACTAEAVDTAAGHQGTSLAPGFAPTSTRRSAATQNPDAGHRARGDKSAAWIDSAYQTGAPGSAT